MQSSYPAIVQAIHQDFDEACDIIVEEARAIVAEANSKSFEKLDLLAELGFSKTLEYKSTSVKKNLTDKQVKVLELVNTLKQKFPFHKIITDDIAMRICKKYNLVMGQVGLYKGFIPNKNLLEIQRFKLSYPGEFTKFFRAHLFTASVTEITEAEYLKNKDNQGLVYSYGKVNRELMIVAPVEDMIMTGKMVKDFKIQDLPPVPDPVVLLPIKEDGIQMYVVLTKWGDEASDPELMDAIMN